MRQIQTRSHSAVCVVYSGILLTWDPLVGFEGLGEGMGVGECTTGLRVKKEGSMGLKISEGNPALLKDFTAGLKQERRKEDGEEQSLERW